MTFGIIVAGFCLVTALVAYGYMWNARRHRCAGPEIGRRFVPGIMERGGKVWGWMAVDDEVLHGYTEVTHKCSECGQYFNNQVVGKINER